MATATPTPIIDDGPIGGPIDTIPNLPVRTVLDEIADAVADYVSHYVNVTFVDVEPDVGDAASEFVNDVP